MPPDPPNDPATDLFQSIHANNVGAVRQLLQLEPELLTALSPTGLSPVLFATYYGRPAILRLLLEAGAPLSVFEAAATGEIAALQGHLDARPDLVNALSADGFTPLGLAAFFGREAVAAELLARGADVNRASENALRVQPLHSAAAGNHPALALRLLAAGADVNAAQHGGFTPLMSAAQNGNAALVEALLAAGADPAARTNDDQDAADLARKEGHTSILALLSAPPHDAEESRNVPRAAVGETGGMTDNRDRRPGDLPSGKLPVNELTGQPDTHTGYQTPDPKDNHEEHYATTPAEDRAGSADQGKYEPVQAQDPKAVTGQFDHLATRDPAAMEHALEDPEFAGAQTVAGIGVDNDLMNSVAPVGLGISTGRAFVEEHHQSAADRNPGYTPPSEAGPRHVSEQPGDLPPGATEELKNAVRGEGRD
jgi:ankyrin repeat protein